MVFDKLIYTNSVGKSVEFSLDSLFMTNIRKDVTGLFDVRATLNRSQIVDVDGDIETGYHVEAREIAIQGIIKSFQADEQEALIDELQSVLSPHMTGTLRYEGSTVREIDVHADLAPEIKEVEGQRWPTFYITLQALNPNWRGLYQKAESIPAAGADVYYPGSKACGVAIEITAGADDVDFESLTITNGDTVQTVTFRKPGGVNLNSGDVMLVNTTPGYVQITLNDADALSRIDLDNTVFPLLFQGTNTITWSAYGDESDFTVSIRYTPLYLGK